MKASVIGVALLLCGGCKLPNKSSESTSSTAVVIDASTSGRSAAVSSDDAPASSLHVLSGIGFFIENKLQTCIDHDRTYKTEADLAKFKKELEDLGKKDKNNITTPFPDGGCATNFKDRTPLASCVIDNSNAKHTGTVTDTYYTVEALEDDAQMRDCLKNKGKWTAIPHDSDAYQMANAEAELRKSQADLKKLQGH